MLKRIGEFKINDIQKLFINKAIELKEYVFDFDLSNKDFKQSYGYTKGQILREIQKLKGDVF